VLALVLAPFVGMMHTCRNGFPYAVQAEDVAIAEGEHCGFERIHQSAVSRHSGTAQCPCSIVPFGSTRKKRASPYAHVVTCHIAHLAAESSIAELKIDGVDQVKMLRSSLTYLRVKLMATARGAHQGTVTRKLLQFADIAGARDTIPTPAKSIFLAIDRERASGATDPPAARRIGRLLGEFELHLALEDRREELTAVHARQDASEEDLAAAAERLDGAEAAMRVLKQQVRNFRAEMDDVQRRLETVEQRQQRQDEAAGSIFEQPAVALSATPSPPSSPPPSRRVSVSAPTTPARPVLAELNGSAPREEAVLCAEAADDDEEESGAVGPMGPAVEGDGSADGAEDAEAEVVSQPPPPPPPGERADERADEVLCAGEAVAEEDDVEMFSPPPKPPAEEIDLTGKTPPPPKPTVDLLAQLGAMLRARDKAKRSKAASLYRSRIRSQQLSARDRALLLETTRMTRIFDEAMALAIAQGRPGDPGDAGYEALDRAGFSLTLWDSDRDEMRTYTYTCLKKVIGADGEEEEVEDGFTWGVWTFSSDDEIGEEPAYMAKEREGRLLTRAGERIVRCARAYLARRAAMPTAAGGLLRLERVGGATAWSFAF
jgi:hypothetical protein